MSNKEKILNGFYGFVLVALMSGVGSVFMSGVNWGFGVNSRLEAQAADFSVFKQADRDNRQEVLRRLDNIDKKLDDIDKKLDGKKDKTSR